MDRQAVDFLAGLAGVGVEQGDKGETLALKAAVAQQGAGEIADADEHGRPGAVDAEAVAEGGDEVGDEVADSRLTEVAKVGEILADLGIVDAEGLADLAAGDLLRPFLVNAFEVAEVETEAVDAGTREPVFAADVCGIRLAHGPSTSVAHGGESRGGGRPSRGRSRRLVGAV